MDNQNQPTQELPVFANQTTSEPASAPTETTPPVTPPSQPIMTSGGNWKKWMPIGLVLVLVIIGGGAIVLSQQKFQKPKAIIVTQPTITQPSPTLDPNADWKTYTNAEHKYSFQHPNTLAVIESSVSTPNNITVGFISQNQLDVSGVTYCGANISDGSRCEKITINETINAEIDWGTESSRTIAHIPHPNGGVVTLAQNHLKSEDERKVLRAILISLKFGGLSKSTDAKSACEKSGGKWLAPYNECEAASGGLDEKTCKELGGTINTCDSACRHDPNAQGCVEVCINVCKF